MQDSDARRINGDRLSAEYNGGGGLLRRYVHGPGVDEPIAWYEGAGTSDRRYLVSDRQGSVIAEDGATVTRYAYGPYGEPNNWAGSRFRYTGQIVLPEASLYHFKARVYDPILGRFLQTDPVGYEDDLNIYQYVHNDPLNQTDPTGRCPWCVGAGIGAVLGAGFEAGAQILTEGEVTDWGAVGREALIGGAAGATGVGLGEVVGAGLARTTIQGLAREAVVGAAAGAGSGASADAARQQATTGRIDAGQVARAARDGAVAGAVAPAAGRAVQRGAAAVERSVERGARDRAAARGNIAARLEQAGSMTTGQGQRAQGSIAGATTATGVNEAGNARDAVQRQCLRQSDGRC